MMLLVSDQYGDTAALSAFSSQFQCKLEVCSPFNEILHFNSESDAIEAYNRLCGHDTYCEKVKEAIMRFQPSAIVAFGTGALATWRALSELPLKRVQHFTGFYPDQIEHFTNLKPACKTDLYFAYDEPSNLQEVICKLGKTAGVHCYRTRYSAGFMNPESSKFDAAASKHFSEICKSSAILHCESKKHHQFELA
ncbi:hypothetical protein [Pseudoalteromonas xiamenensis]